MKNKPPSAAGRARRRPGKPISRQQNKKPADLSIRLNKYIANAGVCSRREADTLITNGAITINGKIVTELGTKVMPGDVVRYDGEKLINEKKIYVLLNKPKDYITTTDDPQQRRTVLHLLGNAFRERLYPVGRLDRNTTGLLLLTNDGELTKKLSHPRHGIKKLYHVQLNKKVSSTHLMQIAKGIELGKERIVPDSISYANPDKKNEIGIEIHSGQNRVVRRIFETFGYDIVKLDRVVYAGLTKKDLPRGKWRKLTEKEISYLKMLG
jgi:23S rRNA pseudouridine2605 synthase